MPDLSVALVLATRISGLAATSRRDIDVVEVHDFFTAIDSISYEGRGFAEQCGGCKFVEAEVTSIGGDLPVNMSDGLTAPRRLPGATGIAVRNERAYGTGRATAAAGVMMSERLVADGG